MRLPHAHIVVMPDEICRHTHLTRSIADFPSGQTKYFGSNLCPLWHQKGLNKNWVAFLYKKQRKQKVEQFLFYFKRLNDTTHRWPYSSYCLLWLELTNVWMLLSYNPVGDEPCHLCRVSISLLLTQLNVTVLWPRCENWPCSCCSSFRRFFPGGGWSPLSGWAGSLIPSWCWFLFPGGFLSMLCFLFQIYVEKNTPVRERSKITLTWDGNKATSGLLILR